MARELLRLIIGEENLAEMVPQKEKEGRKLIPQKISNAILKSIKVLEKKLETLDGIKSPIKVIDGDCHNQEDDDDDDLTMSNNAHSFKRKTNQVDNSEPSAAKKN
ncbi:hypothetical protein KQX54_007393 [Cotesia glomerata]|uniref:Uncharacterized protein n=1 Tax=Cotesia glomerata TaxID=32391 RepID=A0AAV7HWP0_COTGL|nr:hypothetical protein KQX54_007393 [Cotesia glomerata]